MNNVEMPEEFKKKVAELEKGARFCPMAQCSHLERYQETERSEQENGLTNLFTPEATKMVNEPSKWRECSPDHPPCALCGKLIHVGMPVRAFKPEKNQEIAFHLYCAFGLGISGEKGAPGCGAYREILHDGNIQFRCQVKLDFVDYYRDCERCIENIPDDLGYVQCLDCEKRAECPHVDQENLKMIETRL